MFRNFGAPEILILLFIILLLFGAKRLPDMARGMGRSLRIFKAETKGLGDDAAAPSDQAPSQPSTPTADAASESRSDSETER